MNMEICIVGAGPAGLMAAVHAATDQTPTWVVEANADAGRKLLLTGGGRCNFTHAAGPEELARAFGKAGRFLRHSLYEFPPDSVRNFFRSHGLADTVEPDGSVFPAHRGAADVRDILVDEARRRGTHLQYSARVKSITAAAEGFRLDTHDRQVRTARVILATGGLSWPQTGSTGDGYRFAGQLGHTIVPPKPALVPLVTRETWPRELAGVSLPGVRIRATGAGHKAETTGNLLFTQRGIGGPAVLDLSRLLADDLGGKDAALDIGIDVRPEMDPAQLDHRLQHECQDYPKKSIANILSDLLPRQFARLVCRLAQCDGDAPAGQLAADQRRQLVGTLKKTPLCITGAEPIAKATVTHGGVSREEIDPRTMESKIRPGLFFAGEVIDLDGPCGGYNLQMCWSTGAAAGRSAARTPLNKSL